MQCVPVSSSALWRTPTAAGRPLAGGTGRTAHLTGTGGGNGAIPPGGITAALHSSASLTSRCFFPGHWVLTTAAPVTPLTPAVSGLPSPETVLIPVWLCKYKWCGNGGLAAWTDSMQATVRPAGWSDSTWWARASEGIWVKGSVRPTASLQFLKFFYPKRVSLNRERTFFF